MVLSHRHQSAVYGVVFELLRARMFSVMEFSSTNFSTLQKASGTPDYINS